MKVSAQDLALMTRRLADLLGGGLPMSRSLSVLEQQSENPSMKILIRKILREISTGNSFSDTLQNQSKIFGPIYIGLVRAGESAGDLAPSLEELAQLLEAEFEMRQQIRTALAYPLLLLAMSILVCLFLALCVIPRFELLFQDLGQRLPLPTRGLLYFTSFIKKFGAIAIPAMGLGGIWMIKTNKFFWKKWMRDHFSKIPVISSLLQCASLQRWTQVMASMLRGGIPLPEALWLSRQSVGQGPFGKEIEGTLGRLREGKNFSSALEGSSFFPQMLCELVGAAEESGRLDQTFERLARSAKRESELKTKMALSLLEPTLILGMGAIVGFVAVAMLLPIFEMSANIR